MQLSRLLEEILALNPIQEVGNLVHLDTYAPQIEKASKLMRELKIYTRMKQIMAELGERDTDIYIVSHSKSGTTLAQMILYQLTTAGEMDFKHINEVSPWIRSYASRNKCAPSVGERRLFKSHDRYDFLKHIKKGKFIFLIRDIRDVIPSYYQHIQDYKENLATLPFHFDGNWPVSFEEFSQEVSTYWFNFNKCWLENKAQLPILYVNYEDLVLNKAESIRQITSFCDIELNQQILERTLQRSSFQFMKQHEAKFGKTPNEQKIVYTNFIRKGEIGNGKLLFSKQQLQRIQALSEDFLGSHPVAARYFKANSSA